MRFFQALILIPIAILALVISFAEAYDPSPLQDFCVAIDDLNGGMKKNHVSSISLIFSIQIDPNVVIIYDL